MIGISLAYVDVICLKNNITQKIAKIDPPVFFTKMYVYHDTVKSLTKYCAHTLPNYR